MAGENKFVNSCNVNLNIWLMLHNSILFEKKFASNNKFNAFISGNVNNYKKINIYQNDSFQNIF